MSKVDNQYSAKDEVASVFVKRTFLQRTFITLKKAPFTAWLGMTIIAFYLFFHEGLNFVKKLFQIDGVTIIGGMSLTTAFLGFIYSISYIELQLNSIKSVCLFVQLKLL